MIKDKMEGYVVQATAHALNEFLDSGLWKDMENELELWLDAARDGLENPEADDKEIYRNQGRADACRRLLSLPETMRDSLLMDQAGPSRDDSFRGDIGHLTDNTFNEEDLKNE